MNINDSYIVVVAELKNGGMVFLSADRTEISQEFKTSYLIPIKNFNYVEFLHSWRRMQFRYTSNGVDYDVLPHSIRIQTVAIHMEDMTPDSDIKFKILTNSRNPLTRLEQQMVFDSETIPLMQRLSE